MRSCISGDPCTDVATDCSAWTVFPFSGLVLRVLFFGVVAFLAPVSFGMLLDLLDLADLPPPVRSSFFHFDGHGWWHYLYYTQSVALLGAKGAFSTAFRDSNW